MRPVVSLALAITSATASAVDVEQAAAGLTHTCAITTIGELKCWGQDTQGQLGDGVLSGPFVATPQLTAPIGALLDHVVASNQNSCVVTADRRMVCWGWDAFGQLGDGVIGPDNPTPTEIPGLGTPLRAVGVGSGHMCAIDASHQLSCWGSDSQGQLGDGAADPPRPSPAPVLLDPLLRVVDVAGGASHTCALDTAGHVSCWGRDSDGTLGDGVAGGSRATPDYVVGSAGEPQLSGVSSIAAGSWHTCAVVAGGQVVCWGNNMMGQLGDGMSGAISATPKPVAGLSSVRAIAGGTFFTCALRMDGSVLCPGGHPNSPSCGHLKIPQ